MLVELFNLHFNSIEWVAKLRIRYSVQIHHRCVVLIVLRENTKIHSIAHDVPKVVFVFNPEKKKKNPLEDILSYHYIF